MLQPKHLNVHANGMCRLSFQLKVKLLIWHEYLAFSNLFRLAKIYRKQLERNHLDVQEHPWLTRDLKPNAFHMNDKYRAFPANAQTEEVSNFRRNPIQRQLNFLTGRVWLPNSHSSDTVRYCYLFGLMISRLNLCQSSQELLSCLHQIGPPELI